MTDHLIIGLSAWIIQDGNYGDFSRSDHAAFALEFWPAKPLEPVMPDEVVAPCCAHRADATYDAVGRVVHLAEDWWAIDVGVVVFQDCRPPAEARVGSWLRGEVLIAIDPFFYFERHGHEPGVPAMIYEWRIDRIDIQTAPFVEVRPRYFERDASKLGWREVAGTTAWEDDGGSGDYLLHCTRLGGPRLPRSKAQP